MKLARSLRVAVVAAAETAAVSVGNGANRAGNHFQGNGRLKFRRPSSFQRPACEEELSWRPSRSAKKKCVAWNVKEIRPLNALKTKRARTPASPVSQIPIPKQPKTLRHLNLQQIHRLYIHRP